MRKFIAFIFVLFFTITSPIVFAAQIDFDNLNVASTAFGVATWVNRPRAMAAYENKIYFILLDEYSNAPPSKVYCYSPSDGLSNTANHTIIAESAGIFNTVRVINDLLYVADTLGKVYTYDGSTLTELTGTPFSESDYVSSIVKFNGKVYFGTNESNIFRYDGSVFEQVYAPNESRKRIADMVVWQKDGHLYVSVGSQNYCCPSDAYVIRSNSGDVNSWHPVFQGFWYVSSFMPTSDFLYTTVIDSAGGFSSTLRKSNDGLSFPQIHQSNNRYKVFRGLLHHDAIAYFFVNSHHGSYGYRIVDENSTTSLIQNQSWTLAHAVELNGEIYALAESLPYDPSGYISAQDVYLITTSLGLPSYSCTGFQPPMDDYPVTVKGKNRALPLKAQIFDENSQLITDSVITAPPVVQVMFNSAMGGEPVDVSGDAYPAGHGTEGNQFVFTEDLIWQYNLKTKEYSAPGTYTVTLMSGNTAEYTIDPVCETSFVIK